MLLQMMILLAPALLLMLAPFSDAHCAVTPDIITGHVTIPSDWTVIPEFAFSRCEELYSVSIPSTIVEIQRGAFEYAYSLGSVEIPSSVKTIGWEIFQSCQNLTSVTLPDNFKNISSNMFRECVSLVSIALPTELERIGHEAFKDCKALTSISFPDSVLEIESAAFEGCTALAGEVILPQHSKFSRVEFSMFERCSSLQSIVFPPNVTYIGARFCEDCMSLEKLTFPDSLQEVDTYAFKRASSLSEVHFGKSIQSIGSYAFQQTAVRSIRIPATIATIGGRAFYITVSLEDFRFVVDDDGKVTDELTIGEGAFTGSRFSAIKFEATMRIYFQGNPFLFCPNLESVIFRQSLLIVQGLPAPYNKRIECADFDATHGGSDGGCGCQSGYGNDYPDPEYFTCTECDAGYSSLPGGKLPCELCGTGSYSENKASPRCELCPAGKYLPTPGGTRVADCIKCRRGTYAAAPGSSQCESCPPGTFCADEGQAKYDKCRPGHFAKYSSSLSCESCPAGCYQPDEGTAFCHECPAGTYNGTAGLATGLNDTCVGCPAGTYGDKRGLAVCQMCPKGWVQARVGQTACEDCTVTHGKIYTSTGDRLVCVINKSLVSESLVEAMFKDGITLIVSFSVSIIFGLFSAFVQHKKDEKQEGANMGMRLGQLSRKDIIIKTCLPGFTFASECFLMYAIYSVAPGTAVAMLLFRLLHLVATLFFLLAVFGGKESAAWIDSNLSVIKARQWCADFDYKFAKENIPLVGVMMVLCMCDVSLVQLLPWHDTTFYKESNGFPYKSLMRFALGTDTLQAVVSVVCQLIYLTNFSTVDDPTSSPEAEALFGINILINCTVVVSSMLLLFLKERLLKNAWMPGAGAGAGAGGDSNTRTASTAKRASAVVELSGVYDSSDDHYMDSHGVNPLHGDRPPSLSRMGTGTGTGTGAVAGAAVSADKGVAMDMELKDENLTLGYHLELERAKTGEQQREIDKLKKQMRQMQGQTQGQSQDDGDIKL